MDKNKIKSFAVWARRKMIESVTEKAQRIGISKDKIEKVESVQGGFKLGEETFYLSSKHRDALIHQIDEKGFEEVMEEVAYTWFNRFMGLRYMEVNDYLPSGIRILSSSVEGKVEPDVLSKVSDIIEELDLNGEEIYNLLDTGNTSDREKAYRIILVKQCNELGKIIPQMFEKISDYTELLLPDNLLEEGSVIRKMVENIEESDWKDEVEIIGWMYQYYISEKKDEVFAALKKNVKITKENIPAATQLFTPKWIVKYMVENSLGRLWLEGHPNAELQSEWKYYLEEAEQEPEVEEELQKIREEHSKLTPEDIKVLDPCMGSGHILVYAFDVLYEIYKTAGYSEREIPKLILQNNLYGLDIDDRAAQLASFALIMKARHYNRRLFREIEREHLELNLCSIQESNEITDEVIEYFSKGNEELKKDAKYLVDVFTDAKEYGSILEVKKVDFDAIKQRLREVEDEDNLMFGDYRNVVLDYLPALVKQGEIMSRLYEVCVTNPPYLNFRSMNPNILDYCSLHYPYSKADLFGVFIERSKLFCEKDGFFALITMQNWMYIDSFNQFRLNVLPQINIINLIHLGMKAFDSGDVGTIVKTATFVFQNTKMEDKKATFIDLRGEESSEQKQTKLIKIAKSENISKIKEVYFNVPAKFLKVPNGPITYAFNDGIFDLFNSKKFVNKYGRALCGIQTGDNARFLRLWFEVDINNIALNIKTRDDYIKSNKKWASQVKGGFFRKWYGNLDYIINIYNDGYEISHTNGKNFRLRDPKNYFLECLTWSHTSDRFGVRFLPAGNLCNVEAPAYFLNNESDMYKMMAFLNCNVVEWIISQLDDSLHFSVTDVLGLPYLNVDIDESKVIQNIQKSKEDWDAYETSWDFMRHPLIDGEKRISKAYEIWEQQCNKRFSLVKENEEYFNKEYISAFGLNYHLSYQVDDKNISLTVPSKEESVKKLISYVVGCMFGRYSIDADGLIYAGGDFSDKWKVDSEQCKVKSYIDIPSNDSGTIREYKSDENGNLIDEEHEVKEEAQREEVWVDASFVPDKDNIIPITEDEYFEDDIVSRFIEFIRTVYGEENLEENLDYIADSIGRKSSESSRQAIRRYFIKDFYKDHVKIYQKRPIYWMFDSGKNDGFKCLIYMHRYNDQTVAKVRTDYLHTLQRKYEGEINRQQLIVDSSESTAKDKTVAKKKIDRINKQIEECREYDEVVAYLANEKISIDLDDGVKVNYAKFQNVKVINSKNKEVKMNLLAKI